MVRSLVVLLLLPVAAQAVPHVHSNRGAQMGADLWCEEPLNANAVTMRFHGACGPNSGPAICDAGMAWPGVLNFDGPPSTNYWFDPDDSDNAWECDGHHAGTPLGYSIENVGSGTSFDWVPFASEASHLPTGASVAGVVKHVGTAIGQLGGKYVVGAAGTTFCSRIYERFDETSDIPDRAQCIDAHNGVCGEHGIYIDTPHTCAPDAHNCGNGTEDCCQFFHEQYKVTTIGGADVHGSSDIQMAPDTQYGLGPDGIIRASTVMAGYGAGGSTWNQDGTLGFMQECQTVHCRWESCLDIDSSGFAYTRFRKVTLPLSGAEGVTTVFSAGPSPTAYPAGIDWSNGGSINFNDAPQLFGQTVAGYGALQIRYLTRAVFAKKTSGTDAERHAFWIGCDSAMEPLCNDVTGKMPSEGGNVNTTGYIRLLR